MERFSMDPQLRASGTDHEQTVADMRRHIADSQI
jgi:hypothetical protein